MEYLDPTQPSDRPSTHVHLRYAFVAPRSPSLSERGIHAHKTHIPRIIMNSTCDCEQPLKDKNVFLMSNWTATPCWNFQITRVPAYRSHAGLVSLIIAICRSAHHFSVPIRAVIYRFVPAEGRVTEWVTDRRTTRMHCGEPAVRIRATEWQMVLSASRRW